MILLCVRCRKEFDEAGALVFSPPMNGAWVVKHHMCAPCFDALFDWLNGDSP